jgi:S-adenosylmethionine:tRNA-ribosyltransferase-isomerase (queuine synthetase)
MDYKESGAMIRVALEKQLDERIWQRWLIEIQSMDQNNFLNFDSYKNKLLSGVTIKNRSKEKVKIDFEQSRKFAQEAIRRLAPKNDVGKKVKK